MVIRVELDLQGRKGYRATTVQLGHKVCKVFKVSKALLDLQGLLAIQAYRVQQGLLVQRALVDLQDHRA